MTDIALPYFLARPAPEGRAPGVVVIHEGNGISPPLLRLCQRLAHEGYAVVAPDLFFRAGGTEARGVVTLMRSLRPEETAGDIEEAIRRLRELGAGTVAVIGFCLGGTLAYRTALSVSGCDAVVGFYGAQIAGELGRPRCPTLLLFGGDDEYISVSDIEAVVAHHPETVVYPEAHHGFMRDGSASYDEAAARDGWRRMLDFLGDHREPAGGPGGRRGAAR
jgi:carboxymethylenebutenolidase